MTDPAFAPTVPDGPSPWQPAEVTAIRVETANAKTFRLRPAAPLPHLPGQHYVVRLTAPDGYTASRSYSLASPPDPSGEVEITVERLPDGEVSGYLHEGVEVGDELEVRGPIGRWFVWDGSAPAVLVGGGSGVVPLMAMLRHARNLDRSDLVRLVVSIRTPSDLYYRGEIEGPETTIVHTRVAPPGSARPAGHLALADLPTIDPAATVFVCGSNGFADATTTLLAAAGVAVDRIRVERFGATG